MINLIKWTLNTHRILHTPTLRTQKFRIPNLRTQKLRIPILRTQKFRIPNLAYVGLAYVGKSSEYQICGGTQILCVRRVQNTAPAAGHVTCCRTDCTVGCGGHCRVTWPVQLLVTWLAAVLTARSGVAFTAGSRDLSSCWSRDLLLYWLHGQCVAFTAGSRDLWRYILSAMSPELCIGTVASVVCVRV